MVEFPDTSELECLIFFFSFIAMSYTMTKISIEMLMIVSIFLIKFIPKREKSNENSIRKISQIPNRSDLLLGIDLSII